MTSGYKPTWKPGDYKAICDRCGRLRKGSELKIEWDQYFVCEDGCWEPRQPQDFVRTVPGEGRAVQPARPEVPDMFQELPENWDVVGEV
jgi:hypothetical protein